MFRVTWACTSATILPGPKTPACYSPIDVGFGVAPPVDACLKRAAGSRNKLHLIASLVLVSGASRCRVWT
jgi:hypothetical protein